MQLAILPWLQLRAEVHTFGVSILPRNAAIAAAGEHGDAVARATSYFFEKDRRRRPHEETVDFVLAEPSVIILPDGEEHLIRAQRAVDALFFATMLDVTPYRYANATNFLLLSIPALDPLRAGFVRANRMLFGSTSLATEPQYSVEVRPFWCEQRTPDADPDALTLLEAASTHVDFSAIREAISALHNAMTDNPTTDHRMEFANYARGFETLLARSGQMQDTRRRDQAALAHRLLAPQLANLDCMSPAPLSSGIPLTDHGIFDAWYRTRNDRNATIHPDAASLPTLHDQQAVRPNIVGNGTINLTP